MYCEFRLKRLKRNTIVRNIVCIRCKNIFFGKRVWRGRKEKLNYLNKSTTRGLINNTAVKMAMGSCRIEKKTLSDCNELL